MANESMGPTSGEASEPERFLQVVFTGVTRRFHELIAAVERAVFEVPDYKAEGDRQVIEEIRASIHRTAEAAMAALARGEGLMDHDRRELKVTGAQRSAEGMPRRALVGAVRAAVAAGHLYILDHMIEVTRDKKPPTVVAAQAGRELAVRLSRLEADLVAALVDGYDRQRAEAGPVGSDSRLLVDRLAARQWTQIDDLEREAKVQGVELPPSTGLVVLATWLPQGLELLEQAGAEVRDRLPGAMVGTAKAAPDPHVVVLVPASVWEDVYAVCEEVTLRGHVFAFCYGPVNIVENVPARYTEALGHLALPEAAGLQPRVYTRRELFAYRVCTGGGVDDKVTFVDLVLAPLRAYPSGDDLVATLETYFRHEARVAETAHALGLHNNTVRRRLDKIEECTGLHLDRVWDRTQLFLALLLRHVSAPDPLAGPWGRG